MKDGFNLKALFPRYDGEQSLWYSYVGDRIILFVVTVFFCIAGLVGNGQVLWLLGFRIKRKPFAIYVLNLAVADFGSLMFLLSLNIHNNSVFLSTSYFSLLVLVLLLSIFISMQSSCQLLLAALSVDRWVSVLFPNWYQCHESPVLSKTVCAFIWALSFVLGAVPLIQDLSLSIPGDSETTIVWECVVSTLICLLIVSISALTLLIKACLKSQPCQQRNLLRAISLMLLSFLLFTILTIACFFMVSNPLAYYGLWTSIRGSMNPLIYFLSVRQNSGKFQERMKVIFQRVFKEERDTQMELQPRTQTLL